MAILRKIFNGKFEGYFKIFPKNRKFSLKIFPENPMRGQISFFDGGHGLWPPSGTSLTSSENAWTGSRKSILSIFSESPRRVESKTVVHFPIGYFMTKL